MNTSRVRFCWRLPLAALIALVSVFWAGTPASGQSTPSQGMPSSSMPSQDNDTRNSQIANMDRFLDSHPEVSEQLRKDPSLIRNDQFITSHPALQEYLQQHPGIREEFTENPNAFMAREQRFEGREEAGENRRFGGRDITRAELSNMDQFLDTHPEIAEQLRKDPSLINNRDFVQNHPQLQQFLQQHPGVSQEFKENPNAFMGRERGFEAREERGTMRVELSNMDQFLDTHAEIAEQLQKNPSLINNRDFVQNHPELQQFLQQHPGVSQEFKENPNAFMAREQGFERREEAGENRRLGDRDITRAELSNMDQFLDSHPEIAEQVRKDPSLVNNHQFVQNHPQLQQFLQQHPGVSEELKENPNAFMGRERGFEGREEAGENRRFGDRDITRAQLSNMDQFLDSHAEIAEQVRKDPSLVNNHQFVQNHPQLQQFLQQHPGVSQELKENPNAFMAREQRFDQHENALQSGGHAEMSFGQFLGSHSAIAQQLSKNPSLINNKQWLQSHPEVQEYLKANPGAKQQLTANPQAAMNSLPGTGTVATKPTQTKPKQ
jgi:zona occludens toxin (predicted ATPase)